MVGARGRSRSAATAVCSSYACSPVADPAEVEARAVPGGERGERLGRGRGRRSDRAYPRVWTQAPVSPSTGRRSRTSGSSGTVSGSVGVADRAARRPDGRAVCPRWGARGAAPGPGGRGRRHPPGREPAGVARPAVHGAAAGRAVAGQHPLSRPHDVAASCRAVLGVLGEQVEDERVPARRAVRAACARGGSGSVSRWPTRIDQASLQVERRRAGGQFVQHAAQRVQVAAVVDLANAADLLGRHVVRGAHGHAGAGEPGGEADVVAEPGDAEVADLHGAVGEPDDVGRFQVAVHDALVVGVREGVGDLFGDVGDVGDGQRVPPRVVQDLAEVAAVEQFHHQEEHAVVLAEVVHDGDAAVLEGRRDAGLAAEALLEHAGESGVAARGPTRLEALDRDPAAQRLVQRPPDLAHAAAPDQLVQPVAALDQPGVAPSPRRRPRRLVSVASPVPAASMAAARGFASLPPSMAWTGRVPRPESGHRRRGCGPEGCGQRTVAGTARRSRPA